MTTPKTFRIGLVGARGYVGRELVRLLARHERAELAFAVSRSQVGEPLAALLPEAPAHLVVEDLSPEALAARAPDALFLALPNGLSAPVVAAIEASSPRTVLVDLSADHRFDERWTYGLPEHHRDLLRGARRIANPGCYATSMALALRPVAHLLAGPAHAFGVSGYSGAGTTPSPKNDADNLRDNLLPYALVDHLHEREVCRHAGPVRFLPHVAPFFRGITTTLSFTFREPVTRAQLHALYEGAYAGEPFVRVQDEAPVVRDARDQPGAALGGLALGVDGLSGAVVVTLDNLLKGAASQAMQNLNLALGISETMGILPWPT